MLRALRESNGMALSVSDEEMIAEIPRLGRAEGIFFCPEGAACAAALRRLMQNGWVKPTDEVVLFNTASGLKYLDVLQAAQKREGSAVSEVIRVLRGRIPENLVNKDLLG